MDVKSKDEVVARSRLGYKVWPARNEVGAAAFLDPFHSLPFAYFSAELLAAVAAASSSVLLPPLLVPGVLFGAAGAGWCCG